MTGNSSTPMQNVDVVLLDKTSLAHDPVLERLNSVLETSCSLLLAEKGGLDISHVVVEIRALKAYHASR